TALGKKNVFWVEPNCFVLNIVFAWEQAIAKTTESERGMIASHRFPMFQANESKVDLDYLIAYLLTKRGTEILKMVSPGGAGRNKTLSQEAFLKCKIPLPPLAEQKKIAAILSTQDRVIELKERRLEEKRRQKKYLMQVLLSGKIRLHGCLQKWKYVKARTLFDNISDRKHEERLEVLSATQDRGIIPRTQVEIDIKFDERSLSSYKRVRRGNFVISLRSFQGGIEYSDYDGLISPAYTVLSPSEKISSKFYKQYFKSDDYVNRLNVAVYGIRDGKQISYDDFGNIKIPYPPQEVQEEIADILSTADRELSLLRADLEQERQKKKALMQLLLSGLVRVNAKGGEADGAV
ncbi:MAG: restriction endonuclease subunit S, partial [Pyramidobacter sp.]|nr:restriction endonuclease subunit S [Pyramidobacter sp.]